MISQTTSQNFFKILGEANSVLILNPKPDGDSIGASLALQKLIIKLNKKVASLSCFPVPEYLRFIVQNSQLQVRELEVKDTQVDVVILVDACDLQRGTNNSSIHFSKNTHVLCIDHHAKTEGCDIKTMIHDSNAESTCGLITDLCIDYKIANNVDLIDTEIAFLLFCGIVADTDYFGYANVTTDTFERAAYLKQYNFDALPIIKQFRESLSLKAFRFIQNNIHKVVVNEKKRYAYLKVKKQDLSFDDNILTVNEAVNYINRALIRIIDCVDFSFVIREISEKKSSLAMRRHNNGNTVDLHLIAKKFGGGGHPQSAGALAEKSIDMLEKELIKFIKTM